MDGLSPTDVHDDAGRGFIFPEPLGNWFYTKEQKILMGDSPPPPGTNLQRKPGFSSLSAPEAFGVWVLDTINHVGVGVPP